MTSAKVIADSIWNGHRLTTIEACFHRWVLAEFNTHRKFSRNSASSRAIPFGKQVVKVVSSPAMPVVWATEQKGMQGGDELLPYLAKEANETWLIARDGAVVAATALAEIGVHKSIVNRLLEPFLMHTVVVTSTGWENFFTQRCSPLAQPEIRIVAELMRDALETSAPQELNETQWHLPYFDEDDFADMEFNHGGYDPQLAAMVSAARCARVSYLTHDGKRDLMADVDLYHKLTTAAPPHWSPLEHVAAPDVLGVGHGNLDGWRSLRCLVEDEMGLNTNA